MVASFLLWARAEKIHGHNKGTIDLLKGTKRVGEEVVERFSECAADF